MTRVEREKLVMPALPELAVQIIDQAREHGRVPMGSIIKLTGMSRNTLKEHFRHLVAQGYLVKHGSGKGTWYVLPENSLNLGVALAIDGFWHTCTNLSAPNRVDFIARE